MKKKTYYGYWGNGNTYNREPYTDTNARRLVQTMRHIAQGNDTGNGGWWHVLDEDTERGNAYPVHKGRV